MPVRKSAPLMCPQLTQPRSSSIFDVEQKSIEQLEQEGIERTRRTRGLLEKGRAQKAAAADPAQGLPYAPISVEAWRAILSPAQMAQYAFTAYDRLLSMTALQTMQNHDFTTGGVFGRERATYDNLREAMAGLYEASTVDVLLSGSMLSVHLCVPGGSLTHWPVHIPRPEAVGA